MNIELFFPTPPLTPYIKAYYFISPEALKPELKAHFPAVSASFLKFSSRSIILSGQTTGSTVATLPLAPANFGVKLAIGALYGLFKLPAGELTNRVIELEDILGTAANELFEQVSESATPIAKIQRLESVLSRLLQNNPKQNFFTELATLEALANSSFSTVSEIASQLGYSSRQLQRRVNDFTGLSPRLFKRIRRFERALGLIQTSPQKKWADLALLCGYSDQAHFIRDFREFTGSSPAAFVAGLEMSDPFNTSK